MPGVKVVLRSVLTSSWSSRLVELDVVCFIVVNSAVVVDVPTLLSLLASFWPPSVSSPSCASNYLLTGSSCNSCTRSMATIWIVCLCIQIINTT